ncbi:hypothetical protein [Methylobacterium sp. D48H]
MGVDHNRPLAAFAGAVALAALGTGLTVRSRAQRARESEARFGTALSEARRFLASTSRVDLKLDTEPLAPAKPTERPLVRGMSVTFGLDGFAGLALREESGREHLFSIREKSLLEFIRMIDPRRETTSDPAGAPHLRDMGATLVDKARARFLEAQADKLERETAAEFVHALGSDRPFQADRWSVISDIVPSAIIACARDLQGREIRIETSPDRARWLAEHLLAAARQVEMTSDVDRATADAVRRHSEGA